MTQQMPVWDGSGFSGCGGPLDPSQDTLPLSERVAAKVLAYRAAAAPDRNFVHIDGTWLTYGEMDRRANRVARALRGSGIAKGDRVAIILGNRAEYFDLWFGLSRIGAVQLPISVDYKSKQIAQTILRSKVDMVVLDAVCLPEMEAALQSAGLQIPCIVLGEANQASNLVATQQYDTWIAAASDVPLAEAADVSGADVAAVMNTSGTTGPSKGVLLSHAQQYILGRTMGADIELAPDDVFYNFFPLFHNTAQAMITVPVLLAGARMVVVDRFSASRFWSDIRQHGCTAFYYIGEIVNILLRASDPEEVADSGLRVGWGIGASADDATAFSGRFGVTLRSGYGSTEANVPTCVPHGADKPGSAGRVIPGFEVRIADPLGQTVPAGTIGEILVRSSEPCAVMVGYDANPEATVEAWRDLWFHTGDAGRFDDDGFLYFEGRIKDAIRVRGENVSAHEVEAVILEDPAVMEVAAIAVPCELGGDDLKVVAVLKPGLVLTPEAIIERATRDLPKYAIPRYVEFVEAMPKTPTNKIRKNELRATPFTPSTWDRQGESADRTARK